MAQAEFADILASRARHVMVFFTDLFGLRETYNRPGTVSDENWSLRLPRDYAVAYETRRSGNRALNLPLALTMAMHAKRLQRTAPFGSLIRFLDPEAALFLENA